MSRSSLYATSHRTPEFGCSYPWSSSSSEVRSTRGVSEFAVFGRGTPAPIDAPKKLVVRGLYQYTRNPMYIGVLTIILGWAALYQTLRIVLYALCVGLSFHCFIVFYEEP